MSVAFYLLLRSGAGIRYILIFFKIQINVAGSYILITFAALVIIINNNMKKLIVLSCFAVAATLFSCQKENSLENGSGGNPSIIGNDCRISKIVYADSATNVALGSLSASINSLDQATDITRFDSLSFTIDFNARPTYAADTIHINANEYYIADPVTGIVQKFNGLYDPTNASSPRFSIQYSYNAEKNLIRKSYSFAANPTAPYEEVNYTYNAGNLIQMAKTDLTTGDLISDADLSFDPAVAPKNYLYFFPDEYDYAEYTQFYNFGRRCVNAVKTMKVRFYSPGNIVSDSAVTSFSNYQTSADSYVLSVVMTGDDQFSIPAQAGRLRFSYKCK